MKAQVRINNRMVNVRFGYRMGQDEFFSSWDDMLRYWTPFYESRAELLAKARPEAVVETEGGCPLNVRMTRRPFSAREKKAFVEETVALGNNLYTIEDV